MTAVQVAATSEAGRRTQGLIAINIAAVIFGTAALFGRIDASPIWIVAMRAVFASLALLILAIVRGDLRWPGSTTARVLAGTAVILAIHWVTFFASVQLAGVAIATLTFATFPLFTVLLRAARSRMAPLPLEVIAGIAIIIAVGLLANTASGSSSAIGGALLGLGSALAFAVFGLASSELGRAMSPVAISLAQNAVVAIILLPFLPLGDAPATGRDWLWLVALGVVTTALMHQLYFYALQRLSPTICSGFVALEPVYAILLAAIFFGDHVSAWIVVSATMIVGASIAMLRAESAV